MGIEKIGTVISGGQSGVDRAALKFAVHNGISYSGYCPKGGWAEDFQNPPGILEHYPLLKETESPDPEERTVLNVETSDAVLIFLEGDSPGTELCRKTAEKLGADYSIVAFSGNGILSGFTNSTEKRNTYDHIRKEN